MSCGRNDVPFSRCSHGIQAARCYYIAFCACVRLWQTVLRSPAHDGQRRAMGSHGYSLLLFLSNSMLLTTCTRCHGRPFRTQYNYGSSHPKERAQGSTRRVHGLPYDGQQSETVDQRRRRRRRKELHFPPRSLVRSEYVSVHTPVAHR